MDDSVTAVLSQYANIRMKTLDVTIGSNAPNFSQVFDLVATDVVVSKTTVDASQNAETNHRIFQERE